MGLLAKSFVSGASDIEESLTKNQCFVRELR